MRQARLNLRALCIFTAAIVLAAQISERLKKFGTIFLCCHLSGLPLWELMEHAYGQLAPYKAFMQLVHFGGSFLITRCAGVDLLSLKCPNEEPAPNLQSLLVKRA